jgi:predicted outer membrane repeat protein
MTKSINIKIGSTLIMTKFIIRAIVFIAIIAITLANCIDVSDATGGRADDFLRTLEETPSALLTGITAEYVQGTMNVYPGTPLNDLKAGLTVTAKYLNGTSRILADSAYSLSGALTIGTSAITVNYEDQTTTFTVLVTLPEIPDAPLTSISAEYNPNPTTTVFPTTPLNSLKNDLTVIAIYENGAEIPVAHDAYTLSGTLAGGTSSTITVTHTDRGVTRTASFTVEVTVPAAFDSISIAYNQTFPIHYNTPREELKGDLVVTAHYSDGMTRVLDSAEYSLIIFTNNGMFVENTTAEIRVNVCLTLGFGVTDFLNPDAGTACVREFTVAVVPLPDYGRLYAKAPPILQTDIPVDLSTIVALSEIDRAFLYMNVNPGIYTFVLDGNIEVAPHSANQVTSGMANRHLKSSGIKLTIVGDGTTRKIALNSSGRMFTIGEAGADGIEFTIGNNVALNGYADCSPLHGLCTYNDAIFIQSGATFNMQDNALVITTGVNIRDESVFTMQDHASISDGTGVTVSGSIFTMWDYATIADNIGSGVRASGNSIFTMRDNASIFGNRNNGVSVSGSGSFLGSPEETCVFVMMENTTVYGNNETGVSVGNYATFTMQDNSSVHNNKSRGINTFGTVTMGGSSSVYGNTGSRGAGVDIRRGIFTMRGSASVHDNTATNNGGGVYVDRDSDGCTFIMEEDAQIYGNTANTGGGVYVDASMLGAGVFTMRGGTIYGINESDFSNTARTMAAALFVVTGGEAKYEDGENIISIGNGRDLTITR